jgi:hypothetical protein
MNLYYINFQLLKKQKDHYGLLNATDSKTLRKCIEDIIVKACKLSKNTFQNVFLFFV